MMAKIKLKQIYTVAKTALKRWWAKDPFRESAVIAYYSIFSLPGLLIVITSLAGFFFGRDVVNDHISNQISSVLGPDAADQLKMIVERANEKSNSVWATIIGVGTIIVGATGVFAQFQKSLNNIWEVKPDESKSGIWKIIKVRFFSFGIIVSVAFVLIVSLVISTSLSALGKWLSGNFSESFAFMLQVFNTIISVCIIAFLFALMFKIFPDAKIKWKHVLIGSLVTAFLFEIGKFLLGLYFGKLNPGTTYGAAGSIILILLWVSYSSMIVFYGAEFTRAYSSLYSGKVPPSEIAKKAVRI